MKIVLKRFEYDTSIGIDKLVTIEETPIVDKSKSIIKIIEDIADDGYTVLYYNHDTPREIINEGTFTYILKNGHYEWYVPAEAVTVNDFINTYGIKRNETITLVEDGIGGSDYDVYVNAIVEWIPYIIQAFGYYLTTKEIISKTVALYGKLIGRNKRIVSTYDFCNMLQSKSAWTMRELKSKTTIDNENLIELMLMNAGFVKKGKRYQLIREEELEEVTDEVAENIEDNFTDRDYSRLELDNTIQTLNDVILGIIIQSEYYGSDSYERITNILDALFEEWQGLLQRGENLRFVEMTALCDNLPENDLYMLDKAVASISEYISIVCAKNDGAVID